MNNDLKLTLILSSWSSGSTSLAGYLERCGLYSCPPHFSTNDPKTPNAYESKEFKEELNKYINEENLNQIGNLNNFKVFFKDWIFKKKEEAFKNNYSGIVLKHPLIIYLIQQINDVCKTHNLVITRSLKDIEKTRIRRGWPKIYGAQGANIIYSNIYNFLHQNKYSFIVIPYEDFKKEDESKKKILRYLNLNPSVKMLKSASEWIK